MGVDAALNKMRNTVRDGLRFSGSRSGDNKKRPVAVQNRLFLGFVEPF